MILASRKNIPSLCGINRFAGRQEKLQCTVISSSFIWVNTEQWKCRDAIHRYRVKEKGYIQAETWKICSTYMLDILCRVVLGARKMATKINISLPLIVSIQSLSHVQLFVTPWTAARQASLSTNSWSLLKCPLTRWCHPTISSSVIPWLSSCLQSFPASGSFPMNWFFASGGQSIGTSASASVLPMNIRDWFPLGWTGWISMLSKGLSRVFSNTTVQKHQFFDAQLSL